MNPSLLAADRIATLDAYRAHAARGEGEDACVRAAVDGYLAHHPGMGRAEAEAAVPRILFEARRALRDRFADRRPTFLG
jgi:hypothetical protein